MEKLCLKLLNKIQKYRLNKTKHEWRPMQQWMLHIEENEWNC